jgi:hypothetical protein
MAKRLTDTLKWGDDWFLSLDNDYRTIWQWLLDNCNFAGVCKRNIRLLNFMCNTEITEVDLLQKMQGRVMVVNNNWFIPKFLKFQYDVLTSQRPVIKSVLSELEKSKCMEMIPESLRNDLFIIKEKRKAK